MYKCNADPSGRILSVSYSGVVGAGEVEACLKVVRGLLKSMQPGFFLFTDMTHLESMDPECATGLGKIMEECARGGLSASVRVVPAMKDIGLNLIAHFHYPPEVRFHTLETLSEALSVLLVEYSSATSPVA